MLLVRDRLAAGTQPVLGLEPEREPEQRLAQP